MLPLPEVNDTLLTRPVWIQTIQYTYTALQLAYMDNFVS